MKRLAILALALSAVACEPGEKESVQVGYRGVAQELNYDVSALKKVVSANQAPAPLAPADTAAPPGAKWQNVQVLNDVGINEVTRTMVAMTAWVSPKEGCGYCHNLNNMASDEKYPKVVARRMLEMTRHVNTSYAAHVQGTGVTCYTCHRGQPVPPAGVWTYTDRNQFLRAYLDRPDIRVQSLTVAHTDANRSSIKQTENTYALMMNVSSALGVNCTYCHNSRSWATWQNAPPARITSMYGFRMVRDLNTNYLAPLQGTFPPARLGVHGDSPKLQCSTCHQGVYKPLMGAPMVKDYPALWGAAAWARGGPGDTVSVGFHDLRGRDSIPTDASPRLKPEVVQPLPAPIHTRSATTPR